MNFIKQHAGVIAVVALIIAVLIAFGVLGNGGGTILGANQCASGQTCLPSLELTGPNSGVTNALQIDSGISNFAGAVALTSTFQLGSSGTAQSNQVSTTCAMKADLSVSATTTGRAFCVGVTGVTSSDNIIASIASTTGTLSYNDNWVIVGAKASTTAGAIDFTLLNLTGTANVPSAVSKFGSTTAIIASH